MRYGWIFVTGYNPFYFVSKAVLFLQIAIRKMNPWGAWSSSEAEQLLLDEPQMIVSSLKKCIHQWTVNGIFMLYHQMNYSRKQLSHRGDLHFVLGSPVCILTDPVIRSCHLGVHTRTIVPSTPFTPAHDASKVPSIALPCAGQGTSRISPKWRNPAISAHTEHCNKI